MAMRVSESHTEFIRPYILSLEDETPVPLLDVSSQWCDSCHHLLHHFIFLFPLPLFPLPPLPLSPVDSTSSTELEEGNIEVFPGNFVFFGGLRLFICPSGPRTGV